MQMNSNKLLIVDNDPMSSRYTRNLATKLDYDVKESRSASEALGYVTQFSPSLIVVDLNLPDTDGIDMLTSLARLDCKAAILIVGHAERAVLETAETVGSELGLQILGVITKPVLPAEITSWLKSARVNQPFISEQVVRAAVENEEFLLYYQPTLCRTDGEPWHVTGVAAYLRWDHPELGILRPGQFLNAVEQAGLLPDITYQVILEAMRHINYWQERGMSLSIGISIPWQIITNSSMPARLETLARKANINPNLLNLNISDIPQYVDSAMARNILCRIRQQDFQLAFDGFRDLKSSICNLGALPFTAINLDDSLVSLARFDNDVATTISTILSVARELGLEVHAKGVADQLELDILEELGCHAARGNLFSDALPGSRVEGFVRRWNKAGRRPSIELERTGND